MSKSRVPKQKAYHQDRINPKNLVLKDNDNVLFSFQDLSENKYFNLDATCENWSLELLKCMKVVSGISKGEIVAGKYSGKHSTLRIHNHKDANPPCPLPDRIDLEEFYQIRLAKSKGAIHGVFVENIFYVIWLDPHHNMYPDDRYGGLKVITPPKTCCKDRDEIIEQLNEELEVYKQILESI